MCAYKIIQSPICDSLSLSLSLTIECCNVLSATNSGLSLPLSVFPSDIIVLPPMMDRMANFPSPDEINFPMLKREPVAAMLLAGFWHLRCIGGGGVQQDRKEVISGQVIQENTYCSRSKYFAYASLIKTLKGSANF